MEKHKIAIIGGGANGVSVLNELVDKISRTEYSSDIEISLYEKSGDFGIGLAYGTNLDSHILNMPADSMSAVGDDPEHFFKWLDKKSGTELHLYFNFQANARDFIPRKIFGMYLEDMYANTLIKAKSKGINITIIKDEATDIKENENIISIKSNGRYRKFNQSVLCLGNQPPISDSKLEGVTKYFHHAWPENNIMNNIPNDAKVTIIGSSLTAVDVLVTLQEKGHKGEINFVSRKGILPKVRCFSEPYELLYLNPDNISKLTNKGEEELPIIEIYNLFIQELIAAGVDISDIKTSGLDNGITAKEILNNDIKMVENGDMTYFSVLKAIDEVVGEIWNSMSIEDRKYFDEQYKSIWNAYDYPMPMQNARKIMNALDSGQLTIDSGFSGFDYDGNGFNLYFDNNNQIVFKSDYIINATGQNVDIKKIESAIIKNAIKNGVIRPHDLGGIDVDFKSGAVKNCNNSDKVYVVGSLTRGVHFYTNSINENAKCGKRTVESICNEIDLDFKLENKKMIIRNNGKRPENIALFIGSDISSHFLMNELIPEMLDNGFKPFVYFAKHKSSGKKALPQIEEQSFYERKIIADYIYPFLDSNGIEKFQKYYSPAQLAKKYGIKIKEIDNINDPEFLKEIKNENIDGGVVVRCYQKFGKDIIKYFNKNEHNFLWNLHPGILPEYRGVMTFFRSMNDRKEEAGYSLHIINENWDAGPIINVSPQPLNLESAMLTNYCVLSSSGVPIIIKSLNDFSNNDEINIIHQDSTKVGYHTFPTKSEMDEFLGKNMKLVDPDYMRKILLSRFSYQGTKHYDNLSHVIAKAISNENNHDLMSQNGYKIEASNTPS